MDTFEHLLPFRSFPLWKRVLLGIAILTVLVAGIWGLARFVAGRRVELRQQAAVQTASEELDRSLPVCDASPNPDGCRKERVEEAALRVGSASVCGKLEAEAVEDCVWGVAVAQHDPEACGEITDEAKRQSCADSVYLQAARAEQRLDLCAKVTSVIARDRCVETVSRRLARTEGCAAALDASVCAAWQAFEQAFASGDPLQCQALSNEGDRTACLDAVGTGDIDHDGLSAKTEAALGTDDRAEDTDADGLTDTEEISFWGTNPTNPDTDGDGFSDGAETEAGYNPLGEGKR
ncbi:hypothetical protein HY734_01390 [Candidatus Uhrbacteria bacterium]|nr:hypothetical protein [Candidatus Uhrbacteria bacterium]